jgi:dienelactone hydrolase
VNGRAFISQHRRISTPSADACAATLYRPVAAVDSVPCVVMGPGGTLTQRDGIPDFAERFAAAGIAALAFDYRHWGASDGEPRRYASIPRQLADWRSAISHARGLDGIDTDRVAAWGMSLGGGHALTTAAADRRIAAVVAFVPMADGLRFSLNLRMLRFTARALRLRLRGKPVTLPAAGPAGAFPPELLPSLERLAGNSGWRNEATADLRYPFTRYRPVRRAAEIEAPLLVQLGEQDELVPRTGVERAAEQAPRGELRRYPIDHFSGFWPEHIDEVAADQLDFLQLHLLSSRAVSGQPAPTD